MWLIAVCVFFVAIKISFWTKFKTYLRKYQTVPVNNTDGGTTTTSVVCKQYLVELYLGSTFGSCFGEGYRSTCFGHRYRSKRTEDKKKNFFFKAAAARNGGGQVRAEGTAISSTASDDVDMLDGQDQETVAGSGTHLGGVVAQKRTKVKSL